MDKDHVKKSSSANLETQKTTYWLMGVVLAAALLFMSLEWTTGTRQLDESMLLVVDEPEEELLITRHDPPPPPPPPPPEEIPDIPEVLIETEEEVDVRIEIAQEDAPPVPPAPPPPPPTVEIPSIPLDHIFEVVEVPPSFPGGMEALNAWLSSNIRYPPLAQEQGIQGRVFVQFVVERDGNITDATVVSGPDPMLNREALRVVNAMPRWSPGQQGGEAVRVRFTLPVLFRLG